MFLKACFFKTQNACFLLKAVGSLESTSVIKLSWFAFSVTFQLRNGRYKLGLKVIKEP